MDSSENCRLDEAPIPCERLSPAFLVRAASAPEVPERKRNPASSIFTFGPKGRSRAAFTTRWCRCSQGRQGSSVLWPGRSQKQEVGTPAPCCAAAGLAQTWLSDRQRQRMKKRAAPKASCWGSPGLAMAAKAPQACSGRQLFVPLLLPF